MWLQILTYLLFGYFRCLVISIFVGKFCRTYNSRMFSSNTGIPNDDFGLFCALCFDDSRGRL